MHDDSPKEAIVELTWDVRDVATGNTVATFSRYWPAAALRTDLNAGHVSGAFDVFGRFAL